MRAFRSAALLSAVCLSLGLCACKGACRRLSDRLCDCTQTLLDKQTCVNLAAQAEGLHPAKPEDDAVCSKLYERCDALLRETSCHALDTTEGKVACGMARE